MPTMNGSTPTGFKPAVAPVRASAELETMAGPGQPVEATAGDAAGDAAQDGAGDGAEGTGDEAGGATAGTDARADLATMDGFAVVPKRPVSAPSDPLGAPMHAEREAAAGGGGREAGAGSLLSFTAMDSVDGVPQGGAGPVPGAPKQIGRYEIIKLLGEGGFGSVFLAEQRVPVRRKVALKVVKLGMDTAEVLQRFEAERQALALMDHPNVARVFDAGVTDRGAPFFAMEYVEGVPLNRYVDDNTMEVAKRLTLFVDVCRAVQHAHQKGLIHRDLKPGNIIVSTVDGEPAPKVIDFGIAKATGPSLTDTNFRTETGRLIGTPEYMSPEQCAGSVDIDTRTDVYALGVILYELLTGALPFDSKMLRAGGIDGITRIIREVEPTRPSAKVTAAVGGADSPESELVARMLRARKTDLRHLQRAIQGDLDWIVLKALEKDRNRRYETANALAMDVVRHLGNEPVSAGPPDYRYRLGKFARRNKVLVGTMSAVAAALVMGLLLATWGFVAASRARDRAETALRAEQVARESERLANRDTSSAAREVGVQLETSNAVKAFLTDLLSSADPSRARGREVTVREVVERATATLDTGKYGRKPAVEVELRSTLGNTLRTLGFAEQAKKQLLEALETARKTPGTTDAAMFTLLNRAGLASRDAKDAEGAMKLLDEAVATAIKSGGEDSMDTATARQNLALVHLDIGRLGDAERLLKLALETYARELSEADPKVATVRNNLANVYHSRQEYGEAEKQYRDALAVLDKQYGPDDPATASACRNLALVLYDRGDLASAEIFLRRAVGTWKKVLPPEHPDYRQVLDLLADALRDQGKLDEAMAVVRESLAIREKFAGTDSMEACEALSNLANLHQRKGDVAEAVAMSTELLGRAGRGLDQASEDQATALAGYLALHGALLLELGNAADAEVVIRRALAIREKWLAVGDWRRANTMSLLGATLLAKGNTTEAEGMLFEAHQILRSNRDTPEVTLERSRARLKSLYEKTNRPEEAKRVQ